MSLRDFTLVIILSALSLISSFGNILYFVFGVIILCVPARISYICSALISFLIYFSADDGLSDGKDKNIYHEQIIRTIFPEYKTGYDWISGQQYIYFSEYYNQRDDC